MPLTRFYLKAIDLDPALTITFEYAGKKYQDIGKQAKPHSLQWPAKFDKTEPIEPVLQLRLQDHNSWVFNQHFTGPWAWFRFLDWAQLKTVSGDTSKLSLTLPLDRYTIRYQLLPTNVVHPFIPNIIEQFRCPARLTG